MKKTNPLHDQSPMSRVHVRSPLNSRDNVLDFNRDPHSISGAWISETLSRFFKCNEGRDSCFVTDENDSQLATMDAVIDSMNDGSLADDE